MRHHDPFWDIHIFFNLRTTTVTTPIGSAVGELVEPVGIPVVGPIMTNGDIEAPPNVARASSTHVVPKVVCADGAPSTDVYVSIDDPRLPTLHDHDHEH